MTDAGRPRGAHVLDAALDVIATRGFDGLSVRAVAARAGVSSAQVQYYFRSKDELLAAAFEYVGADVARRAELVETSGTRRELLRALLEVWLPLDEARTRSARVWLAYTAAAATSPSLGPMNATMDARLRTGFADVLSEARAGGELGAGVDVEVEAALLLAVVDGLVLQALALPADARAELLLTGIDTHLDRLFGDGPHEASDY